MKIVIKLSGFFYYMLDNMLWVINVGVISKRVAFYSTMKSWKNIFSLVYNYFQMFKSIIGLFKAKQKLNKILKEMELHKHEVVGTTSLKATEIVRRYINQKQKIYDHMFVLVRNTLRILILNYKLRIVFWKDLFHPIFVSFLGIFQNITAFFKIWLAQRHNRFDSKLIRMEDFLKFMPRME